MLNKQAGTASLEQQVRNLKSVFNSLYLRLLLIVTSSQPDMTGSSPER